MNDLELSASELIAEHTGNTEYLRGGGVGEVTATSALRYRDVVDAYADLEHALEHHEPLAATEAAFSWWAALDRLMQS